ncbi:MAG: hypothetical protein JXR63_09380 [Spirochaetales bacterium]|nr:hypothetical protein [Spirochaetales bacterium]
MKKRIILTLIIITIFISCDPFKDSQKNEWLLHNYKILPSSELDWCGTGYPSFPTIIENLPKTSEGTDSYGYFFSIDGNEYLNIVNYSYKQDSPQNTKLEMNLFKNEYTVKIQNSSNMATTADALSESQRSMVGYYPDKNVITTQGKIIVSNEKNLTLTKNLENKIYTIYEETSSGYEKKSSFANYISEQAIEISEILKIWDMTENSIFFLAICKDNFNNTSYKNIKMNITKNKIQIIEFPENSLIHKYMGFIKVSIGNTVLNNEIMKSFGRNDQSLRINGEERIYLVYSKESDSFLTVHYQAGGKSQGRVEYNFIVLNNSLIQESSKIFLSEYKIANITAMKFNGSSVTFLEQAKKFTDKF